MSSWAPWLEPLPDAQLMRETDRWAIEERAIPGLELMERAGEGLARVTADVAPGGAIAVVCGKGNNGGDGYVAARLLRQAGRAVRVLALWPPGELSADAEEQVRRLPGEPPQPFAADALDGAAAIVDAILGTGFEGAPREPVSGALAAMDAAEAPVVAADVPSGVNASTGEVAGAAVHAVATATFHRAKPSLWIAPGKRCAGAVHVIDIGIPAGAPGEAPIGLMRAGVLQPIPHREPGSTKFTSGNVFVIGGSRGLTGAPAMAAMAAQRAGAGYVTVAAPRSLELSFSVRLLEAMFVGLPEQDGTLSAAARDDALAAISRADCVVLGPGFSKAEGAQALARELAVRIEQPLVIDADGLNAHARRLESLAGRSAPTVLTPHAGELGRLLGVESAAVEQRRLEHALAAARQANAIVVLKGDDTLVCHPSGRVAVSPGGAPALATAGTGDVLSGVTGALLAKGMEPLTAASAAVYAHLIAGRIAARPHGPDSVVASDVIAALPAALAGDR